MKALIAVVAVIPLVASAVEAAPAKAAKAQGKAAVGAIVKFECGDNCYLTIKPAKGKEITGLCAQACSPWATTEDMPPEMVGRIVSVTLGMADMADKVDASGKKMGRMTSFKTLKLMPEKGAPTEAAQ